MNALSLDSARLSDDGRALLILDQTLLPGEVKYLRLTGSGEIWEAIRSLRVRGAPAIGVAAAIGAAVCADSVDTEDAEAFLSTLRGICDYLGSARPTAVNLEWALHRIMAKAEQNAQRPVDDIKRLILVEAEAIRYEDMCVSRAIGEAGLALMPPDCGILTHCNAGTLATAKYGTALAPVYIALERGRRDFRVYCDETRPLLQGARLTALEMVSAGVDTTLICDSMAASLMAEGKIDLVFVGCDRVARNGDAANKIGTLGVAVLARHFGVPFYVCAPSSTIDMSLDTGAQIPIEQRGAKEVTEMWYEKPMAPEGVKVHNPAFDVTPHELITGIITEKGLLTPPFETAFSKMYI